MQAFPSSDHAGDLKDLDLGADTLSIQRSLGLIWDLCTDSLLFFVGDEIKPYTQRGVLSTINSLFDLLGFVAPVTIKGKAILRNSLLRTAIGILHYPKRWRKLETRGENLCQSCPAFPFLELILRFLHRQLSEGNCVSFQLFN